MANLLTWLGDQIEGGFAQANPWDNDADYNSVMRRKKQEQAQQQAQRPVQPRTQQTSRPTYQNQLQQNTQPRFGTPSLASLNQNSVINRSKPGFDLMKGAGDVIGGIGKGVADISKPISQGGINPLADAGNWVEKNVVPTAVDTVKHPEKIVSGIQQSAGNLADISLIGGNVLEDSAAALRGASPQERANIYNRYNTLRNQVKNAKTVTGESLNPQADFQWSGNAGKDLANLTGRGLNVGLDATSFLNPTRLATGTLVKQPLKQTAKFVARDAGFFGAGSGLAAGAQNFAQTGDINQAVNAGLQSGIQTAIGQGTLDLAGTAIGRAKPLVKNAKTFGLEPPTKLTPDELWSAQKVVSAQNNPVNPVDLSVRDMQLYRQAQDKLGAKPGTPDGHMAVVDALNAHRNFDVQVAQRKQATLDALENSSNMARKLIPGGTLEPRRLPETQLAPTVPKTQPIVTAVDNKAQVPALLTEQQLSKSGGKVTPPTLNALDTPIPQKNTRYASQTIPKSEFVGEQVGAQTKANAPKYTPETERGRYSQTLKSADQIGFDNFENDVHARLQDKHIDSQTVADSQAVAQRLEAKGDDASLRKAADIYDRLSEHLTKAGQTVQAAAIMSRRTPEGMKYQALNDLRKGGIEISPELQRKINTNTEAIAKTQPATEARKKAIGQLAKTVQENIPNGAVSNLVSVWKAGLLSGLKTTQGNILSNATFGALKKVSDIPSYLADTAMSTVTGKVSMSGTQRGTLKGLKEGISNASHTLKTGVDIRNTTDKYDMQRGINFKNKTVQKYLGKPAQKVFDFMGAQDQPFYFTELKNSLYDQAKVDGINKGLNGKALSDHMNKLVENPPDSIMQRASDEAAKAVLGYDTVASKFIQGGKQTIDRLPISDVGKQVSKGVIDVLAPFVRVPTAFLSRTVDFTPLGIGKEALSQIAHKKFDQRSLAKAIGEGITGTGMIVLGAALTQSGQISGDYPSDPKEQQRWKAEGIKPNSVQLGGNWLSLNYLGPIGMLFGAGKKFEESAKAGGDAVGSVSAAIGGLGQSLLGQSFLQGLSGFVDAAKDPKRYLEGYVNGQAGSVVPSLLNDFTNLTDGYQRDVNNGLEAILNRIPGARETLNAKQDVYGNKLTQNPLDTINALRPSPQITNNVKSEVARLSKVDPNNKDLQVTPTTVDNPTINGQVVKLNDKQKYDFQTRVGQATQNAWDKLIKTDDYKQLTDIDKAQSLSKLRTDVSSVEQRKFVEQNNLGTYDKPLTNSQKNIANGSTDIASYAKSGDSKGTVAISDKLPNDLKETLKKYNKMSSEERDNWLNTENDAQYKYDVAKFNNDKADGKLSTAETLKGQKALRKSKVGSAYSKNVRDLYGLSKADLEDYLTTEEPNVDKKKIAEELFAYDKALNDARITTSLKFKYGLGSKGKGGGKGKKGSGVTEGKKIVSLTQSVNKIRAPKVTNAPEAKVTSVQMKKAPLKKYNVTKTAPGKAPAIKTSKA